MWGKISYNSKRKHWCVTGKWQGKRYYFSQYPTAEGMVPCETKRLAVRLQEAISAEIEQGSFHPARYRSSRPLLLKNYIPQWLKFKKTEVSNASYHDYCNSLNKHVLPILGNKYLPDINFDDLRDLQNRINRRPKGKKNVMDALKQLMHDAQRSGYIAQLPEWPKFKGKNKIVRPPIVAISMEDQMKLIENIPVRHRPIFLFMMATGCRPSEARALRKTDIKDDWVMFEVAFDRLEELKEVKQAKPDPFPMTEEVGHILGELPKNFSQWVFPNPDTGKPYDKNINRIWNKACDVAGIQRIKLYNATRHSFACGLLNKGVDKYIVSRLLRHSDIRMIERYAEYEMNPLKEAVDKVRSLDFHKQKRKVDNK